MNFETKKIKILFVIEQTSISYKYFENILIELQQYPQFNVEVFNFVKNDFVNDHLKQFCSKMLYFTDHKPYKKQLFKFKEIVKISDPDIIHSHEVIPTFYSAMALLLLHSNKKLIFHRHHSFYRNIATRFMEKIAFFRCNIAISVSKTTQNAAFAEHPFGKNKIIQLYNGITINSTNNISSSEILMQYEHKFKIVLLSRLRTRKGHDTAIEAIDLVRLKIPNIVLFFAGEGNNRIELERMICEKKLMEYVILLGDVSNIKSLLNEMDISILPSESEAFNLSILETFACNKLSIASNLPSIKECITDGKTGVLIEPKNAVQLAEKIIYYLKNERERLEIAGNGKKLYEEKFTTAVMVNKLSVIYTDLIGNKI